MTGNLTESISQRLSEHLDVPVDVERSTAVGGGSINDAFRVDTNEGPFFLKTNKADRYPSMFKAESHGLELLRHTDTIAIPKVLGSGEDDDTTWLLLEWLDEQPRGAEFWKSFGSQLARLHRKTANSFGLERDNYIGSLVQRNTQEADWVTFLIEHRLQPMMKMALDNHKLQAGTAFRFERLFNRLPDLLPKEAPALLHGDLWSGNFISGETDTPWLIDPAIYYGHREMDIAMTMLFGGFDRMFYDAYEECFPLELGWASRMPLCQLYPLLVHVNLFGGSYTQQLEDALARYV